MWLRLPALWPQWLTTTVYIVLLTGLDLAATAAAKEAVDRNSLPLALGGFTLYGCMFWVLASSFRTADLAFVMLVWCVCCQVGALALDRFRYGVHLSFPQGVAVVVLLSAMAFLIAVPPGGHHPHVSGAASNGSVPFLLPAFTPPSEGVRW